MELPGCICRQKPLKKRLGDDQSLWFAFYWLVHFLSNYFCEKSPTCANEAEMKPFAAFIFRVADDPKSAGSLRSLPHLTEYKFSIRSFKIISAIDIFLHFRYTA